MKKAGIPLTAALVFVLSSAMAFAEDESKPIGIDVWAKVATNDALAFDLAAKVGATYTAPFGLAVGIDSLAFPLYPAVGIVSGGAAAFSLPITLKATYSF